MSECCGLHFTLQNLLKPKRYTLKKHILYLDHVSTELLSEAIECNFQREKGFEFLVNLMPSEFFISPPRLFKSRLVSGLVYGTVESFPKFSSICWSS